ncbi:hypothetical protein RCL1_006721 [Eukaryota sp. TZLM3-RCL]
MSFNTFIENEHFTSRNRLVDKLWNYAIKVNKQFVFDDGNNSNRFGACCKDDDCGFRVYCTSDDGLCWRLKKFEEHYEYCNAKSRPLRPSVNLAETMKESLERAGVLSPKNIEKRLNGRLYIITNRKF